jgi:hypothetical protein
MQCENVLVFMHGYYYFIEQRKKLISINIFRPMSESLGIDVSGDLPNYPAWREYHLVVLWFYYV